MAKQKLIVAGLLIFCILLLGTLGIGWWRHANRAPLPPLEDISGIRIRSFYDKAQHKEVDFDIPEEYWSELLAALSPCEKDHNPANWKVLACLDFVRKSGTRDGLLLFYLEDGPVGAFEYWDSYYRGGNSIKLKQVIDKAHKKSRYKSP